MMPPIAINPQAVWAASQAPRADRATLLLGAIAATSVLLFAATLQRFGQTAFTVDAHLYYIHAHSWYFDGDLNYANNIAVDPTFDARDIYLAQRGPGGLPINIFPCGWSMVALPFLALADAATAIHNLFSTHPLPRDGFTNYYAVLVPLGHVLMGLVGLFAAFTLAARYFSRDLAAAATAIVWIATNVSYFVSIEPTMSHAASLGFVSLTLLAADTLHRSGWNACRALALGTSMGMMCAVRHQDAAWIVAPILLLFPPLATSLKSFPSRLLYLPLTALAFAASLLPQLLVNFAIHGTPTGGAAQFTPDWLHPKFFRDLFLLPGGLFVLFPLTLFASVGLLSALRSAQHPRVALALIAGLLACLYLNACGIEGTTRRYVCMAPAFIFGLCALWQTLRPHRWAVRFATCCLALLMAKNALLLLSVERGWVDRYIFTAVIQDSTPVASALLAW